MYIPKLNQALAINCLVGTLLIMARQTDACGPGRSHFRRSRLRKMRPLVQHECVPNVSENTLAASGRPEGTIRRDSKRFKNELVQNWNPYIVFRHETDRMMTQRLKERLNILAIIVMNQWPKVRLRVIEGWDEDRKHSANSLHYEGRAVDITTSDKDKTKYGMLARLAVEAGFDWVHYESRSHVHCSVKSERADIIRNNGCFDGSSRVRTPDGDMEMSQLQLNDLVLTMNPETGVLQYNPVMMWLDKGADQEEVFVKLQTKSNRTITLTPTHLIYLSDEQPDLNKKISNLLIDKPQQISGYSEEVDTTYRSDKITPTPTDDTGQEQIKSNLISPSNSDSYYYYDSKQVDKENKHNVMNQDERIHLGRNYDKEPSPSSSSHSFSLATPNYGAQTIPRVNNLVSDIKEFVQFLGSLSLTDYKRSNLPSTTDNNYHGRLLNKQTSRFLVEDYTDITYARNAVVGQYLLVDVSPEGQLKESKDDSYRLNSDDTSQEKGIVKTKNHVIHKSVEIPHKSDKSLVPPLLTSSARVQKAANSLGIEKIKLRQTSVKFDQIVSIEYITKRGVYAPLTRDGNIVVDSVVASCYAMVNDHKWAHFAFAPFRWVNYLREFAFGLKTKTLARERTINVKGIQAITPKKEIENYYHSYQRWQDAQEPQATGTNREIHWYAYLLYFVAKFITPSCLF